jgi:hypothetical protein
MPLSSSSADVASCDVVRLTVLVEVLASAGGSVVRGGGHERGLLWPHVVPAGGQIGRMGGQPSPVGVAVTPRVLADRQGQRQRRPDCLVVAARCVLVQRARVEAAVLVEQLGQPGQVLGW